MKLRYSEAFYSAQGEDVAEKVAKCLTRELMR